MSLSKNIFQLKHVLTAEITVQNPKCMASSWSEASTLWPKLDYSHMIMMFSSSPQSIDLDTYQRGRVFFVFLCVFFIFN